MSIKYECDFCGASAPIESNLTSIIAGDQKLGDACFNCTQAVKTVLNKLKQELHSQIESEPQPVKEPEPEEAPKEEPEPQPEQPQEGVK